MQEIKISIDEKSIRRLDEECLFFIKRGNWFYLVRDKDVQVNKIGTFIYSIDGISCFTCWEEVITRLSKLYSISFLSKKFQTITIG